MPTFGASTPLHECTGSRGVCDRSGPTHPLYPSLVTKPVVLKVRENDSYDSAVLKEFPFPTAAACKVTLPRAELDPSRAIFLHALPLHKIQHSSSLSPGFYATPEKLLKELNRCVPASAGVSFSLTEEEAGKGQHFRLDTLPPGHRLELTEGLHYVLGFPSPQLTKVGQIADFPPDLQRGAFAMFIYCDIVEPNMVGNTLSPLLRTTHLESGVRHGVVLHQVFHPALYVKVCRTTISVIEVDIRTDTGEPFPLSQQGKMILTLHFKKDSPSPYSPPIVPIIAPPPNLPILTTTTAATVMRRRVNKKKNPPPPPPSPMKRPRK